MWDVIIYLYNQISVCDTLDADKSRIIWSSIGHHGNVLGGMRSEDKILKSEVHIFSQKFKISLWYSNTSINSYFWYSC